jgi:hypothetical protein
LNETGLLDPINCDVSDLDAYLGNTATYQYDALNRLAASPSREARLSAGHASLFV